MVRMIAPIVNRGLRTKTGKGFSLLELTEAGLNAGEAKHISIPVDTRRNTNYPENVQTIKKWVEQAKKYNYRVPTPKQSSKGQKRRALRSLTSSGKKMRALSK